MVQQECNVDQLKILVCDLDNELTTDINHVSQDPLDAARHMVGDEVGLESLLAFKSSPGYPLEDILLCHLPSIDRLVHLRAQVEMKPLS
jgi:hypothetical protein